MQTLSPQSFSQVAHDNVVEWPKVSSYAGDTTGIFVQGNTAASVQKVVIRDNVMRRLNNIDGANDYGIRMTDASDSLITSNIIDVGNLNRGVSIPNTITRPKPFSNTNRQGTLVQAFNPDTSALTPELATILADADMALFR